MSVVILGKVVLHNLSQYKYVYEWMISQLFSTIQNNSVLSLYTTVNKLVDLTSIYNEIVIQY